MNLLSLISMGLTLLIAGFNGAMFCIIKFNDFAHMERKLEKISKAIEQIDIKLDTASERIATLEGRLQ